MQQTEFGGTLNLGRRKSERPLSFKQSHHFVLKAERGSVHLLRNKKLVEQTVNQFAKRFGIRIYELAVHGDHIHLNIFIPTRTAYRRWIRSVTSRLVAQIVGLKFSLRPWSRAVAWGRAFDSLKRYIQFNKIEGSFLNKAYEAVDSYRFSIRLTLEIAAPKASRIGSL